jgi:PAS domain S-box-containing protein
MRLAVHKPLAFLACILGIATITAWWGAQEMLTLIMPNGIVMVFNTALCFAIAGGVLLLPDSSPLVRKGVFTAAGIFIFLLAAANLFEDLAEVTFGIDHLFVTQHIVDLNPHPGRMAPQTAFCFMLSGLCLVLLQKLHQRAANLIVQWAPLAVLIFAMIGFAGAWIRLELLYSWYKFSRMSLPTAAGFIFLSGALWLAWYARAQESGYLRREEKRISACGIAIIIGIAFTAGMSVFGILSGQLEDTLEASLTETYNNQSRLVENEIYAGIEGARPVTTRLLMNKYLTELNTHPNDTVARVVILQEAQSFLGQSFSGLAIDSAKGNRIAEAGKFLASPDLVIPLTVKNPGVKAELLWGNSALLRMHFDIAPQGVKIGSAIAERPLLSIVSLLLKKNSLGETAETRICAVTSDSEMNCLPSLHNPQVAFQTQRILNGISYPMHYALNGEQGIRIGRDYSDHQVIAAYGPIGNTGLGIVVKIDTAEFYGPIRDKLQYVLLLLTVFCAVGIWIQRVQLVPLVARLVRSEREAQSGKARLQGVMHASPHAIIATGTDSKIILFNHAAEKMLLYRAEEMIGKQLPFIYHDREEMRAREAFLTHKYGRPVSDSEIFTLRVQESGVYIAEWTYIRKDGSRLPVEMSLTALTDHEGQITGYMSISQDITARKEIEAMKNEFISVVSHELRTPLTSIRGALGLMAGGAAGALPPKADELVGIAHKNSERLVCIINDILDIEKIESGKLHMQLQAVDVRYLLTQAIEANRAYAERFKVNLRLGDLQEGMMVEADPDRLMQVMANLLSNACKFSPEGSDIEINATSAVSGCIRIFVRDHGQGIPAAFHSRIFGKFMQVDSSNTRRSEGTGLGLSITKRLIEAMDGSITFESEEGKGTVFIVELPQACSGTKTKNTALASYSKTDAASHTPRILHVEDETDLSNVMATALHGKAELMNVTSIRQAEKLLKEEAFALIVLDLTLPDGSGLHLLERIQDIAGYPIPVLVLSASETTQEVKDKVEAALVKSRVSEKRVLDTILALINRKPSPPLKETA